MGGLVANEGASRSAGSSKRRALSTCIERTTYTNHTTNHVHSLQVARHGATLFFYHDFFFPSLHFGIGQPRRGALLLACHGVGVLSPRQQAVRWAQCERYTPIAFSVTCRVRGHCSQRAPSETATAQKSGRGALWGSVHNRQGRAIGPAVPVFAQSC